MHAAPQHTPVLPVVSLLLAATMWGVIWIPLRWLEQQGLQGLSLTLLVYLGTLIYIVPILVRRFAELAITPGLLFGIMLCSGWCNTAFILAILEGEVVRVILLFYLSPVWATLLARFVLKEAISGRAYLVIMLAIAGAMIMLWSPQIGIPWPQSYADWLAISSGFAFAMTNMFINKANKTSIQVKMIMSWLGVIIVAGIFMVFTSPNEIVFAAAPVIFAMLTGILLIGPMTVAVVYGVTHMPIHRSAVILLFEVVASVVSTYLLIEERLSVAEWIGGCIVVCSAYLATRQPQSTLTIANQDNG